MKRYLTLGCLLAATVPALTTARLAAQDDAAPPSPYGLLTPRPVANPYPYFAGAPTDQPRTWLTQTANVPGQAPAQPQVGIPGPQPGAGIYAHGGTCSGPHCVRPQDIFRRGQVEVQALTGYMHSPYFFGPQRPTMDFLPQALRVGVMLNDPDPCRRWLTGTFEVLGEVNAIPIVNGPGSIIVGGSVLGRYNMPIRTRFPRLYRFVPYQQVGFGAGWTDANTPNQLTNFGAPVAFNFQSGGGFHYLINSRWAVTYEGMGFLFTNFGINRPWTVQIATGFYIGVTRFLR